MGTQQILLLILALLTIGVAIAVGIGIFSASNVSANKDAIVNDLMNLGQYAYRYRLRPEPLGGGSRKYTNFKIPQKLQDNENAHYEATEISENAVTFQATSRYGYGTITVMLNDKGELGTIVTTGEF